MALLCLWVTEVLSTRLLFCFHVTCGDVAGPRPAAIHKIQLDELRSVSFETWKYVDQLHFILSLRLRWFALNALTKVGRGH